MEKKEFDVLIKTNKNISKGMFKDKWDQKTLSFEGNNELKIDNDTYHKVFFWRDNLCIKNKRVIKNNIFSKKYRIDFLTKHWRGYLENLLSIDCLNEDNYKAVKNYLVNHSTILYDFRYCFQNLQDNNLQEYINLRRIPFKFEGIKIIFGSLDETGRLSTGNLDNYLSLFAFQAAKIKDEEFLSLSKWKYDGYKIWEEVLKIEDESIKETIIYNCIETYINDPIVRKGFSKQYTTVEEGLYAKVVENDKYKEEARLMKIKLLSAIKKVLSKLGGKKKYKTKRNLKINKKSKKLRKKKTINRRRNKRKKTKRKNKL
jgi:hypothetical protein